MGILADNTSDDLCALQFVIDSTVAAWLGYTKRHPEETLRFECNPEMLPAISEVGGRLLSSKFPSASLFDRVATMVVVFNCAAPFKFSKHGTVVKNIDERRVFLSKLSTAFMHFALSLYKSGETDKPYCTFRGFKTQDCGNRFFAFLENLDSVEITTIQASKTEKLSHEELHALKIMTRDVISVANFLMMSVSEGPIQESDPSLITFEGLSEAQG